MANGSTRPTRSPIRLYGKAPWTLTVNYDAKIDTVEGVETEIVFENY